MALSTQPYKGTRDFYPEDMRFRRWMFDVLRKTAESFGYLEYDGPQLEPFELYAAKTGEEIVSQQLYWLMDKGERKLAVRPEMTPTLARMVAAKIHELPKPIRLYSIPNLWRYERPQRGRLREHWQLNVDVLGGDPLYADCEILSVASALISAFGGGDKISIRINNRKLMDHLLTEKLGLKAEVGIKVTKAIDAREKIGEEKYITWLTEMGLKSDQIKFLDQFFKYSLEEIESEMPCQGATELQSLFDLLDETNPSQSGNSPFVFDPTIMRGMDYYTGTVFEIYDTSPENRRAMFGGGRYDNLVGLFGKDQLSGVGFGMGDVTLQHFLETHALVPKFESFVDYFIGLPKPEFRAPAERLAATLRAHGKKVVVALNVEGFSQQLKQASRLGAKFAILFGDDEWAKGEVILKDLEKSEQKTVPFTHWN